MPKSKIKQIPEPHNIYVTGIPQLIYAAGIPNLSFNQVILVQIAEDSARDGSRPFSVTYEIVRDICMTLGIPFKKMHLDEIQNFKFYRHDVIDCQIVYRLRCKPSAYKCKILAAQHEYVNIKRPRMLSAPSQSWKKRINLLIHLVLPNRMWRIYTLTPNPPFGFIKEITIDQIQVRKFRSRVNLHLATQEKYNFLSQKIEGNVLFVLPIPRHWGGELEIQKDFFEVIKQKAKNMDVNLVIIKNHPSDPTNYIEILEKFEVNLGIRTLNFDSELMRIMPVEIMVESSKRYSFIGTESTVYLTLSAFVSEPTVIIDCDRQTPKKLQEYQTGELRTFYRNYQVGI